MGPCRPRKVVLFLTFRGSLFHWLSTGSYSDRTLNSSVAKVDSRNFSDRGFQVHNSLSNDSAKRIKIMMSKKPKKDEDP